MNLSEILEITGIICFDPQSNLVGGQDHLQIVGRARKVSNLPIPYIVWCRVCSQDPEVYGEGYFKTTLSNLSRGTVPCGCGASRHLSKPQLEVLAKRVAKANGIEFNGLIERENKTLTNSFCSLVCPEHGEWSTTTLNCLLNRPEPAKGNFCRKCSVSTRNTKPDSYMINRFLSTGSFHKDTEFQRSEKLCPRGYKGYWVVNCPLCSETYESHYSNLAKGKVGCSCGRGNYFVEAYINMIMEKGKVVGLKFGVSKNSRMRVIHQSSSCIYDIESFGIWKFPNKAACIQAERLCKEKLVCGILSKQEMPDGYTETTYAYNIETIISIYESLGGVRV